jgi:RND superfamily putative drug exporter
VARASAIDSTLVRCLLVPAVMVLLGKRAWWLPRWMDRIVPHISIEGEEFFAARDAEAAAATAARAVPAPLEPARQPD